jgi:hypothetical protein
MKKLRHRISAVVWGTSALLILAVLVFALR